MLKLLSTIGTVAAVAVPTSVAAAPAPASPAPAPTKDADAKFSIYYDNGSSKMLAYSGGVLHASSLLFDLSYIDISREYLGPAYNFQKAFTHTVTITEENAGRDLVRAWPEMDSELTANRIPNIPSHASWAGYLGTGTTSIKTMYSFVPTDNKYEFKAYRGGGGGGQYSNGPVDNEITLASVADPNEVLEINVQDSFSNGEKYESEFYYHVNDGTLSGSPSGAASGDLQLTTPVHR